MSVSAADMFKLVHHVHARQVVLLVAVLALAALFWYSSQIQEGYLRFVSTIEGWARHAPHLGALLFVALATGSAMLSPLSSVAIVPAANVIFGTLGTAALLLVGWVSGGCLAYAIGRKAGFPLVERFPYFKKFNRWREHFSNRTEFALALVFRLGTPSETGYVFGIIRYSFWRYLLITLIAEVPFALIVVYASDALIAKHRTRFVVLAIAGFCIAAGMWYIYSKVRHHSKRP